MALIHVQIIEGLFTAQQKQDIVERLTDVMVEIEGENMRRLTWCLIDEVPSGQWGIGGEILTADDARALARATPGHRPGQARSLAPES
jgi:4-oxalocrotonate tautomerase